MEFLPPLGWVAFLSTLAVEAHIAGIGWSRRYRCERAYHARSAASVAVYGTLLWLLAKHL